MNRGSESPLWDSLTFWQAAFLGAAIAWSVVIGFLLLNARATVPAPLPPVVVCYPDGGIEVYRGEPMPDAAIEKKEKSLETF